MKAKVALLLILLVSAFTPMITVLTTTFILPTINAVGLATTAFNLILEIQPLGDPIDDPNPPGISSGP